MIKEIVKDQFLLSQRSTPATPKDMQIIIDLQDTLDFHRDHCVGMAANMIGCCKRIIVVYDQMKMIVMINPEYMQRSGVYHIEEGCLCHSTEQLVQRYEKIKIAYLDTSFKKRIKTYQGFVAQIIQHEMDHLEGVLI